MIIMSEEKEKNTPETSDKEEAGEKETIEDTKTQLAEMYLNFLDKQKGGILGTAAWMGANFNPNQKAAIEYLTAEKKLKEKTSIFANLEKNMKSKFMEKLTWWTMLEYDKKSLAKMKALITQYKDDQNKLQELMTQIQEGTDPTMENLPIESSKQDTKEIATAWVATVTSGIVASEIYDKKKYREPIESSDAKITSKFGKRTDPVTGEKNHQHNGIDIAMPKNTPVHSIVSGKVIENKRDAHGWGNYIAIQWDDGKIYSYLHLNTISDKKVGTIIQAGDEIGKVGSTGKSTWPHLHITIKENDKPIDPLAALPEVFEWYTMAA